MAPDASLMKVVMTYESGYGLGGVLLQKEEDVNETAMYFTSRKLKKMQK